DMLRSDSVFPLCKPAREYDIFLRWKIWLTLEDSTIGNSKARLNRNAWVQFLKLVLSYCPSKFYYVHTVQFRHSREWCPFSIIHHFKPVIKELWFYVCLNICGGQRLKLFLLRIMPYIFPEYRSRNRTYQVGVR